MICFLQPLDWFLTWRKVTQYIPVLGKYVLLRTFITQAAVLNPSPRGVCSWFAPMCFFSEGLVIQCGYLPIHFLPFCSFLPGPWLVTRFLSRYRVLARCRFNRRFNPLNSRIHPIQITIIYKDVNIFQWSHTIGILPRRPLRLSSSESTTDFDFGSFIGGFFCNFDATSSYLGPTSLQRLRGADSRSRQKIDAFLGRPRR